MSLLILRPALSSRTGSDGDRHLGSYGGDAHGEDSGEGAGPACQSPAGSAPPCDVTSCLSSHPPQAEVMATMAGQVVGGRGL